MKKYFSLKRVYKTEKIIRDQEQTDSSKATHTLLEKEGRNSVGSYVVVNRSETIILAKWSSYLTYSGSMVASCTTKLIIQTFCHSWPDISTSVDIFRRNRQCLLRHVQQWNILWGRTGIWSRIIWHSQIICHVDINRRAAMHVIHCSKFPPCRILLEASLHWRVSNSSQYPWHRRIFD